MNAVRIALLALMASLAQYAAAQADVLDAKLPPQAWSKTIGSERVEKYGSGTPALILIPGLASGPWSWRDVIAREAPAHTVYALTLAGFDGVPPGDGATLDGAESAIVELIGQEHLDRPVVVGHSLGGTLALRFGIDHPASARAIVAVDGTPVFPALAEASPDQRAAAAQQFYTTVATSSPADYAQSEARFVADYVTDQTLAAKVAALALRSDQKAVAEYGKELYLIDLRPQLGKLTVPVAEILPIPSLPLPTYMPEVMAQLPAADRRNLTIGFYQSLFAGATTVKFLPVDDSRHFVMLDQPAAFAATLDGFLTTLK
jgi:pimeloyl-ACP methyl ester carboxylesterase